MPGPAERPAGARLTPAVAEWLRYLAEIGYGDLRRDALASAPPAAANDRRGRGTPAASQLAPSPRRRQPLPVPSATSPASVAGGQAFAAEAVVGPVVEAGEPLGREERLARLESLATEVAACRRCRLCEGRQRTVFGSGNAEAQLMFVGEGPGADEDRQGLPFVGKAGELLTKIIAAIGLEREQVYIANIVKCRPPGNRDPQPDEVAACRPYLDQQLALIRPRVVVALGRVAAQALLGSELPVGRLRGRWYGLGGATLRVTYHPAALLRAPELKRPTWEDMQRVQARLLGEDGEEVPPTVGS